jgi:hypothetical protein
MDYLIGLMLAAVVCGAARLAGFDRERVFYPTLLIVIASYYVLFAVMGADREALLFDSLIAAAFLGAALLGFRGSLWTVVVALAAHGVFDALHQLVLRNSGVPGWWPAFCLAFDLAAAALLALLLVRRPGLARQA